MRKKGIKQASAFVLTAAFVCSAAILPNVYAALAVNTDAVCSVEVDVTGCSYKELNGADPQVSAYPVTVHLYKVADIDGSGQYTPVESIETLDLTELSHETTAAQWEALAAAAKAEVEADDMTAAATGTTTHGEITFEGLPVGLYLVDAVQVLSDNYQYDFTPYLISLPNNYYYDRKPADDTWVYDLTGANAIGIKPEKSDRYGDLEIVKVLDAYNATLGGANFVFQVEGSRTDIDTGEVTIVYSDVLSMTFENPGEDRIWIREIPAGSVMTVTEVYTGASYELASDGVQTVTILANEPGDTPEGAPAEAPETGESAEPDQETGATGPVTVTFENTYDGRLNGGTGLVNTFSYNAETGEWTYEATEDSTP